MKRTLLAMWAVAIVALAGFGLGAESAQAYIFGDSEWRDGSGSRSARRAASQRVARWIDDDDEDRPRVRRSARWIDDEDRPRVRRYARPIDDEDRPRVRRFARPGYDDEDRPRVRRYARPIDDDDRPQVRRRVARSDAAPPRASRRARSQTALPSLTGGGFQSGIASYYSSGLRTASGARFNPSGMTAAHRTLPFGTRVQVTNHGNGRSVVVTINDRGPFIRGRVIDLSRGAAAVVGMGGLARVSLSILGR